MLKPVSTVTLNSPCKTEGCTRPWVYKRLGLCNICYHRLRAHGVTTKVAAPSSTKHPRASWGNVIDQLRLARGIHVRDLCKEIGIDHNTYSRMLRPDGVNLRYYVWLAEFFSVPLSTLFEPVSTPCPTSIISTDPSPTG